MVHTSTTSFFSETHLGTWLPPTTLMLAPVTFRISETITPPFPNRQPTWFDGTTRRAVTDGPLFEPEPCPFSVPPSKDFEKTRTTAFCAGEYLDSGFCTFEAHINTEQVSNMFTFFFFS